MSHGSGLVRTTCSSGGAPGPSQPSEGLLDPVYPRTQGALLKVAQMIFQGAKKTSYHNFNRGFGAWHFGKGTATGHPADCLHLRAKLLSDRLWRPQLLRSCHHVRPDNDPGLLPGPPLPPLPSAHLHQLAAVGTSTLFNRHPASLHRLHSDSLQELQPGSRSDLWVPGQLPLPRELVAVLQDHLHNPVIRHIRLMRP